MNNDEEKLVEDIEVKEELSQEELQTETTPDNDQLIEEGESYGMVDSGENLLAFSVDNLYSDKDETKFRKQYSLRKSPPVLEVSSSDGTKVTVPLTYNFVKSLLRVLNEVNFAYLGMKKTKNKFNLGSKEEGLLTKIKNMFSANKLKVAELAIGTFLGISLTKGFMLGTVGSLLAGLGVIVLAYSNKNNEEMK